MGHYRHVIWDWNGTLLDDAWLCVEVLNGLLARRRYAPISLRQYGEDFDFPVIDYYRRLGFDFERESFDAVAHEFLAEYDRRRCECRLREAIGLEQRLLHVGHGNPPYPSTRINSSQ